MKCLSESEVIEKVESAKERRGKQNVVHGYFLPINLRKGARSTKDEASREEGYKNGLQASPSKKRVRYA